MVFDYVIFDYTKTNPQFWNVLGTASVQFAFFSLKEGHRQSTFVKDFYDERGGIIDIH